MMKTDEVLTKCQTKIMHGYLNGMIGKEIADWLNISYRTVVVHTQNMYEKLGIPRSTHALVSWWYQTNFDIDIKKIISVILILFCIPTITERMYVRGTRSARTASYYRVHRRFNEEFYLS